MKDRALVPGGHLLHSYDARTIAARLATVHTLAIHAMTSDRPYRESLGEAAGHAKMVRHAGTQFDPAIVIAA